MKRTLFFVAIITAVVSSLNAFAQGKLAYQKGNQLIKVGIGIGAPFSTGETTLPPLQAHYEYAINDEISIGGLLGYSSSKSTYSDVVINYNTLSTSRVSRTINYSYLLIGARANYHFETGEKFDPYGGATLGYNKIGFDDKGGTIGTFKQSMLLYGAHIGANYYFAPNIAAWAEAGYGLGYLNIGIALKL